MFEKNVIQNASLKFRFGLSEPDMLWAISTEQLDIWNWITIPGKNISGIFWKATGRTFYKYKKTYVVDWNIASAQLSPNTQK